MEFLKMLESIRSPFLDTVIGLITRLGEETVGVVILCLIFWCISKSIAYNIGIVYFLSGLTVQGMKICFRIDRPWVIDPTFNPIPSAIEHATGYSFPSGHTQAAAALFGSIGTQVKQHWLKWTCFAIALLVAFSRLYLGVHTPQDVIVSLLICGAFITLTHFFFDADKDDKKRDLIMSSIMVLYAIIVIVIAFVLHNQGHITDNYISDCLKAAGAGIGFAVGFFIERTYIKFSVKTKSLALQCVKFLIGIAGVLIIKEGLKLVIGTGLAVDTLRYFLMLTWISVFFPLIIKRFFGEKSQTSAT